MTHFVYPYKEPLDRNFGWELKMSLRSIHKNFKGHFDITIIGEIPSWVDQSVVRCIKLDNDHVNTQRQGKINQKIIKAADLFDEFVVMNDDICFMKETTDEDLRVSRKLDKKLNFKKREISQKNSFSSQMRNTFFILKDAGYQHDVNFVSHCPHYYNSEKIRSMLTEFDVSPKGFPDVPSVVFENLYWNFIGESGENSKDYRFGCWSKDCEYDGQQVFNFDENGSIYNSWIKKFLFKEFDLKCRAEKLSISIAPHEVINNFRNIQKIKGIETPVEDQIDISVIRAIHYKTKEKELMKYDIVLPISIKQNLIAQEQLPVSLPNMMLVPKHIVDMCVNKDKFISKVQELGLSNFIPLTYSCPSEIKFSPIFKKPTVGTNYEGIEILSEIPSVLQKGYVYQEVLEFNEEYSQNFISDGKEVRFSNSYVYLDKKKPYTIQERMNLYENGRYKQIKLTDEIKDQMSRFVLALGYKGPGNINFIYIDGQIKVFEINAGFGTTLLFDLKEALWKLYYTIQKR